MKKKLTLRLGQTIKCQVCNDVFTGKITGFDICNNEEIILLEEGDGFVYHSQVLEIVNN